jgi:hypothetical protein
MLRWENETEVMRNKTSNWAESDNMEAHVIGSGTKYIGPDGGPCVMRLINASRKVESVDLL